MAISKYYEIWAFSIKVCVANIRGILKGGFMTNSTINIQKNNRLDIRLSKEQKNILETAAMITGQSLTLFCLSNMLEKAQIIVANFNELQQIQQTILSKKDSQRFIEIFTNNNEPNIALKAAFERYGKHKNK